MDKNFQLEKENKELSKNFEQLKNENNNLSNFREKYNLLIKDKISYENFVNSQENKLKNLQLEINNLNKEIKGKDLKYEELDKKYFILVDVIDNYKKNFYLLSNKHNKLKIYNNKLKNIIFEKEQEINVLREFFGNNLNRNKFLIKKNNNNLKSPNKFFSPSLKKTPDSDFKRNMKQKKNLSIDINNNHSINNKIISRNKLGLPMINSMINIKSKQTIDLNNNNIKGKNSFYHSYNNLNALEPEEENIKEINLIMKKIINEESNKNQRNKNINIVNSNNSN